MIIRKYKKRKIVKDLLYGSIEVSKFINIIMRSGKKFTARKILYDAFNYIKKKFNRNPMKVFSYALDNIGPMIEVKTRKIGGGSYTIPTEIKNSRRIILSMKWLKESFRVRSEKYMYIRLANELFDAYNRKGISMKRRYDLHKVADSNRAYSHYYN